MKNSMARSTVGPPSEAATGKKDTTRYTCLRPSCVQYSIFSATADKAPLGRLSMTLRIGSMLASVAAALITLAGAPVSSTEPKIGLGR